VAFAVNARAMPNIAKVSFISLTRSEKAQHGATSHFFRPILRRAYGWQADALEKSAVLTPTLQTFNVRRSARFVSTKWQSNLPEYARPRLTRRLEPAVFPPRRRPANRRPRGRLWRRRRMLSWWLRPRESWRASPRSSWSFAREAAAPAVRPV